MVQDILDKHFKLEFYLTETSTNALAEDVILISSEQVFTLAPNSAWLTDNLYCTLIVACTQLIPPVVHFADMSGIIDHH